MESSVGRGAKAVVGAEGVRWLCAAVLGMGIVVAVVAGWGWPLSGDSALMHYVVRGMRLGQMPYRDLVDINLPGTYLFEAAGMAVFGDGARGWRMYDAALLVAGVGACFGIAGRRRWFAAAMGGGMLAVVHLQDGIPEGGQRDLLIAVLLLWAYVPLLAAVRGKRRLLGMVAFGVLAGTTVVVKPVFVGVGLGVIFAVGVMLRRRGERAAGPVAAGLLGLAVPSALAGWWMGSHGVLGAFWENAVPLLRLHAGIGGRQISFLLAHCVSPVTAVFAMWCGLVLWKRERLTAERALLLVGFVGAVMGYVAQGKGFTYQRYEELALLLVLMGIDFEEALSQAGVTMGLAVAACCWSCLVLAPRFAWLTTTFSGREPFAEGMAQELTKVGEPLDGQVQCLDTFGGCVATMYDLRLRQSTGFLYDCYLFDGEERARERYRAEFWAAYAAAKPRVLIVTDQFCFGEPGGFDKVERWPMLADEIARDYEQRVEWRSAVQQHFWKRYEEPTRFRMYVRKGER